MVEFQASVILAGIDSSSYSARHPYGITMVCHSTQGTSQTNDRNNKKYLDLIEYAPAGSRSGLAHWGRYSYMYAQCEERYMRCVIMMTNVNASSSPPAKSDRLYSVSRSLDFWIIPTNTCTRRRWTRMNYLTESFCDRYSFVG